MPDAKTRFLLRDQSFAIRVAVTCLLLIIAGGYGASLYYMVHHVSQKDNDPELTWLDLVATYHGVDKPAPILAALDEEKHRGWLKDAATDDLKILRDWLGKGAGVGGGADPIQQGYDALPPGASEEALTPADVLDEQCVRCHGPSASDADAFRDLSLERWPDVRKVAYSKKLDPISTNILAQSTHAHALSIPMFTLLACACLLATRFPRWMRHGVCALAFLGLLVDFGAMWLARTWEPACFLIVGGGGVYGVALGAAVVGSLLSMWLGRRTTS